MADDRKAAEKGPPDKLALYPLVEQEDVPPPYANQVRVYGGTDALVIEFYYVNHSKYFDALRGDRLGGNIERVGDTLHLRTTPVARVAIPLTTAGDLVINMLTMAIGGLPEVQRYFGELGGKLGQLIGSAQAFAKSVSSAGAKSPPGAKK